MWIPVDAPGVRSEDLSPGLTFTYETPRGQEFWTVVRTARRADNGKFDITYLIVEPTRTKFKTFQADPGQVLWSRVMTWKRPG